MGSPALTTTAGVAATTGTTVVTREVDGVLPDEVGFLGLDEATGTVVADLG